MMNGRDERPVEMRTCQLETGWATAEGNWEGNGRLEGRSEGRQSDYRSKAFVVYEPGENKAISGLHV